MSLCLELFLYDGWICVFPVSWIPIEMPAVSVLLRSVNIFSTDVNTEVVWEFLVWCWQVYIYYMYLDVVYIKQWRYLRYINNFFLSTACYLILCHLCTSKNLLFLFYVLGLKQCITCCNVCRYMTMLDVLWLLHTQPKTVHVMQFTPLRRVLEKCDSW